MSSKVFLAKKEPGCSRFNCWRHFMRQEKAHTPQKTGD